MNMFIIISLMSHNIIIIINKMKKELDNKIKITKIYNRYNKLNKEKIMKTIFLN